MGNYDFELDLSSVNTMSVINSWIDANTHVLEFGSANGRLTRYLKEEKKCKITIVEIDEEAGRQAAQYADTAYVGTEYGNIDKYYWLDDIEKYDYIILADVLEHLSNPQEVLRKCKKVLNENGKILVSIPNIAHNSILIDLFNDKFCYDEVGLLDKTHIHFFTYKTFETMIRNIGLYITKQVPIYSRVGWNEIHNTYHDVPHYVERELRKRKSGCIYQYVFCISQCECSDAKLNFDDIQPLQQELNEDNEISCYWWENDNELDYHRVSKIYKTDSNEIRVNLEINRSIKKLRLDLLENNALIIIEAIKIKLKNGNCYDINIKECNACKRIGNIFLFTTSDPIIELDVDKYEGNIIENIEVSFKIIDNSMEESDLEKYEILFSTLYNIQNQDTKIKGWRKSEV